MQTRIEYHFPPFRLDPSDARLRREDAVINLRPKTFDVLCCLVERAGRLVTKEEILTTVWPGAKISSAGLKRYIQEIRIALGDDAQAPRFVEAVPRRGYRFLPAVTGELVSSSRFLASRQHQEYVSLHYEERETN